MEVVEKGASPFSSPGFWASCGESFFRKAPPILGADEAGGRSCPSSPSLVPLSTSSPQP